MAEMQFLEFMDEAGLKTPLVPSPAHPEGRVYVIPSPDFATGARLAALAEITAKVHHKAQVDPRDVARLQLDDDQERDFMRDCLGSALDAMVADGVAWEHVRKLSQYAYIHWAIGPEQAARAAESGVMEGKVPTPPNRAARRATAKPQTQSDRPASTATRSRKPRA